MALFVPTWLQRLSFTPTDGLPAYRGLETLGYSHEVMNLIGQRNKNAATKLLPRIQRVASLLKQRFLGTHQGVVSPQHVDYYLDQFTFRFNQRKFRSHGKLFCRLLLQAMEVDPVPYRYTVGGVENPANHKLQGSVEQIKYP